MLVDSIVIGNTVESMFYALKTDSYHLTTPRLPLLFYRQLEVPILGNSTEPKAWSRLYTMLGLCGKLINFEDLNNIKIEENVLKASHAHGLSKFQFEQCQVFDSALLSHENEVLKVSEPSFIAIDDFELRNIGRSVEEIQPRITPGDFMKKVYFYTSERVDGANYITDCVSESILTPEQMLDFNFSDTMAMFVVERHLNSVGVFGLPAGIYANGSVKYRKPKVKHVKRLVSKVDNNTYKDTSLVRFFDKTLEDILNE